MATTPTNMAAYGSVADFNRFSNTADNPFAGKNAVDTTYNQGGVNFGKTAPSLATPVSTSKSSGVTYSPVNQYAVVTSNPATANYNSIQTDYNNNIKPAVANAAATTAQNTAVANSLPVINGYNVSAAPTGNQGEQKATNNTTGQSYYITPQGKTATAGDIASIISGKGSGTGSGSPAAGGAPSASPVTANQTPSQQATNQTGINPTSENSNFQNDIKTMGSDLDSAYESFKTTISSIMSGAFPLSAAQQSLVDATNAAFKQMTEQSNLKAAALSSQTGGVANKVNATAGELTNITAQQAATIAKLEIGFQDQNYKMVTDSYAEFKDLEKSKMDAVTTLHNSVMDEYNRAVAADQAQQTFNEAVFKDNASLAQNKFEFRDLKDEMGNTVGTQVFDKATGKVVSSSYNSGQTNPTTGVTTPTTTTNPDGTVNKQSQYETLKAVVPKPYQDLVWQIVNGKGEAPNTRTKVGMQLASWVAQVDPSLSDGSGGFDATKYQARLTMQKSLASYTSGSYGAGVLSANKVIAHLGSLGRSISELGNGPISSFVNKIGGAIERPLSGLAESSGLIKSGTGLQSIYANAEIKKTGVTDEMAKFFKGTGSTDVQSIKDWGDKLDVNATPSSLHGTLQGGLDLFAGQINAFTQQYTTVMGKEPDMGTILQPQTLKILSQFKNEGFKVDIPGVYYTDKTAYIKNGGSSEALKNSYDQLKAAGIPTTPENILQASQLQ